MRRSPDSLPARWDHWIPDRDLAAAERRPQTNRGRRGAILADTLIASMAIGTAAVLSVVMLASVNGTRRTAERVLLATQELSNQMERLTAKPWTELTPELVQQAKLSASAAAGLPQSELKIRLEEVAAPRPGKRLEGELRWQDRGNSWRPPLRLTAWVFAPQEAK
jgi:hypothetical protein